MRRERNKKDQRRITAINSTTCIGQEKEGNGTMYIYYRARISISILRLFIQTHIELTLYQYVQSHKSKKWSSYQTIMDQL